MRRTPFETTAFTSGTFRLDARLEGSFQQLGRIHALLDQVDWGGWRFDVVGMNGRRIDPLLITPPPSCIQHGKAEPEVV
jgi:hypothetical protein